MNIAHTPWREANISALYDLSLASDLYEPIPESAPSDWTLAIRYEGNGQELDGPGNIAFDADGNAWVCNNYTYSSDPIRSEMSAETTISSDSPRRVGISRAPYQGGGLYGAGFGITLDPDGNVWVGNFGFQGSGCR